MDLGNASIDQSIMVPLQIDILPIALTFLLYGAFAISAGLALYLLIRRPKYTYGTIWMLVVVLSMLCIATLHTIFVYIYGSLALYSFRYGMNSLEPAPLVAATMREAYSLHSVTVLVNLWLGDSIILSRMWNICPESRRWNIFNTVLYVISALLLILRYSVDPIRPPLQSTNRQLALEDATLGLLLLVNIIGTAMMVQKHRKMNISILRVVRISSNDSTKVLQILVEYGIVYSFIQLFNLIFSLVMHYGMVLNSQTSSVAHKIVTPGVAMFAGIFPTLSLALVAIRNTGSRSSIVSIRSFTNLDTSDVESLSTSRQATSSSSDSHISSTPHIPPDYEETPEMEKWNLKYEKGAATV